MKNLEKLIYNLVKRNVFIKNVLRYMYQSAFLLTFPKKIETQYDYQYAEGYFFGFHDKTPWNSDNSKILAQKYPEKTDSLPQKDDFIEIGYFTDNSLTNFVSLDKTQSWNWQQGTMLQWLGVKNAILFNFWDQDSNKAKIIDTQGNILKIIPKAVGAVSNDGKLAVCYDFERLNTGMHGYGYANCSSEILNMDTNIPKDLGFSIYDIENEKTIAFKSVFEINELLGQNKLKDSYLFVTHFIFSPDNNRILFLLRNFNKGKRTHSRLLTCDSNGENIYLLPTGNMVSHLSWVDSNRILAYASNKQEIDGYYLFDDLSQNYQEIASSDYNYDGHPQYSTKNKLFVTDSYPNRRRIQELSVYSIEKKQKKVIGKFFAPMKFSEEFRSDLHPRWDRTGKMICIDTTFSGKRSLAIINFESTKE